MIVIKPKPKKPTAAESPDPIAKVTNRFTSGVVQLYFLSVSLKRHVVLEYKNGNRNMLKTFKIQRELQRGADCMLMYDNV